MISHAFSSFSSHSIRFLQRSVVLGAVIAFGTQAAYAATYTVTSTADSGAGSLRDAVEQANVSAGTDTIDFDSALSGAGDVSITLSTALPSISEALVIDGTTLADVQDGPDLTIVGASDGSAVIPFSNDDAGNVIKGLSIRGAAGEVPSVYCIYAAGTTGLTIGGSTAGDGNWINNCPNSGIKLEYDTNTTILGNTIGAVTGNGVAINAIGSASVTIGGTGTNDKNILVNSTLYGIGMSSVSDVSILGNWIGTANGTTASANGSWGVYFDGTLADITIGGTTAGARNVISGNTSGGINIFSGSGTGIAITGNYIGTNAAGDTALANGYIGVYTSSPATIGGTTAGAGNVISGNSSAGISLQGAGATTEVANVTGATVQGNIIGLNAAGNAVIPNTGHGIVIQNSNNIIGGTTAAARNIISGNAWQGVLIQGNFAITQDNTITGNYIGTDVTGDVDLGNGNSGIFLGLDANNTAIGGTAAGAGNIISGNSERGIILAEGNTGNTIEGNIIGLNVDTDTELGNTWSGVEIQTDGNTVGGTATAARNIISANGNGVTLSSTATGNTVENNYIGTDALGTGAFGNTVDGVYVVGSALDNIIGAASAGNIISDNGRFGIFVEQPTCDGTIIKGNYVGVDSTGAADLGNGSHGILIGGANTVVGGTTTGEGNVISGNAEYGLILGGAGGATVQGNMIGTNAAGTSAIANGGSGVYINESANNTVGGTTTAARNIISGNSANGVLIVSGFVDRPASNNVVEGNYIGTNAAGDAAIANAASGVQISAQYATANTIGGTATGAGNLISGNTQRGVFIDGDSTGNTVAGNLIGLAASGTSAIGNGLQGVDIVSSSNTLGGTTAGSRNVISGNTSSGVLVRGSATGVTVENNYIGTNAAGTAAVANGSHGVEVIESAVSNFIGVAGYGNVISGNTSRGIHISGVLAINNSVQGNIIGLAADGTAALGNTDAGIVVIGAAGTVIGTANSSSARNIISSNTQGIWIFEASNITVVNNYIGLASDGTTVRTNSLNGVYIEDTSASNTIGGTATGAGNTVAAATGESCFAINANAGNFNLIRHNSCVNESGTVMNITRGGTSNENVSTPVVTAETATTSYVAGTTIANGTVDIFVNGVYAASATADGSGVWSKAFSIVSGGNVSASVTNGTSSTSATTTPQVTVTDDAINPTVSSLSPADNATGVVTSANLVITFSEAVTVGTGNIVIKKGYNDATLETIAVTDGSKVTGTGTTTITINPTTTLGALVGYYVQIDATAFDDISGNGYAGISTTTTWNFTTAGTAGFTVSAISSNTTEALGTATFTVRLSTEPTASVSIPVSSSDTSEGTVSVSTLTFTTGNWDSNQTVTVTGVNDDIDDGNVAYSGVLSSTTSSDGNYSALNPSDVSITNTDDDTAGFTVSAISGNTTEALGTATFTVRLNSEPTADVVIPLFSSDTTEGTVSVSSKTFTSANWDSNQTVTVTGVHDNVDDGNVSYLILLNSVTSDDSVYHGVNPSDVSVTNTDDDTAGFTVSAISSNTTEALGTATFTVRLNSEPTASVTVGVSSSDTSEGIVSPSTLVFNAADWGSQVVTVTGVNDESDDGDIAYSIVLSAAVSSDSNYAGMNPSDVSVTNTDNDDAANQAPVFSGTLSDVAFVAGSITDAVFDLDEYFSDPDSDALRYAVSGNDGVIVSILPSGEVYFGSNADFSGVETVTFTGTDSGDLEASSNAVTITVTAPEPIIEGPVTIDHVTGTLSGVGRVQTYDTSNVVISEWIAFTTGGVVPQLVDMNDDQYIIALNKKGDTGIHIYNATGALLASKQLTVHIPAIHYAIGDLNDDTNTKEVVITTRVDNKVRTKVYQFNATTHTLTLVKSRRFSGVKKEYTITIVDQKVVVTLKKSGKVLYSWTAL